MKSSLKSKKKFIFGSFVYCYYLIKEERKILSLTVAPDLSISVKCPYRADNDRIEVFLRKKWFWLEKQLCFFRKYQRKKYRKEYLSGESFLYLGRQYQLFVKKVKQNDRVLLLQGKLFVETTRSVQDRAYTKKLIDAWYRKKMAIIFPLSLEKMSRKFRYDFSPELDIRFMSKRWGSAVRGKKIVLHPVLIQASRDCIEYVITHELCHFTYRKHDQKFWDLLNRKYPGWKKVKEKLEIRHG